MMRKTLKFATSNTGALVVGGVIVAVGVYVAQKKAKETAEQALQAINPVNNDNVFNQGVSAVGRKLSGNSNWTLGGWIYDITHD